MTRDNRRETRKVLIITLWLNLLVLIIKATVGIVTNSLSLQADALHSVTDSANNVLGLVTNQMSSPQPDKEHPYGHQKFEAVGALGIAAFLGIACFEIVSSALERLFFGTKAVTITAGQLWVLLIVLGINIFVAYYERRVGMKIGSEILIADAYHTMSDVWITIMVLLGLIGVWQSDSLHMPWLKHLDVVLAFPVAVLVIKSAWEVLRRNLPGWWIKRLLPPS